MCAFKDIESPVNLGNPKEFTIFELADKITEITGKKLEYVSNILPVDDPQKRCPDIAFAKDKLNWEPKIPLSKGLLPTLKWFQVCLNE